MSDPAAFLPRAASARRDVHRSPAVLPPAAPRKVKESGLDFFGRFVGPHDIDRGLAHFWDAPHRRGATPIVRPDPVLDRRLSTTVPLSVPHGATGQPRKLRAGGLTLSLLRILHARHRAGVSVAQLAREVGVGYQTVRFHLAGSASMQAALRGAA